MLWIKNDEVDVNVTEYDHLTIDEVQKLHEKFGDCPVIHNGHVVGFTKEWEVHMLKNLYLICGKSGSGKTYVTEKLHDEYGYAILKSYTTRRRRHPSDDDHTYVTLSDYYDAKSDGIIAASTCFDHNFYWSTIEQLNTSDLYVIDKAGIDSLKKLSNVKKNVVVIYVNTSEDIRIENMKLRGDTSNKIYERLKHDEAAFNGIEHLADFIIDGDNMNKWVIVKDIIDKCETLEEK